MGRASNSQQRSKRSEKNKRKKIKRSVTSAQMAVRKLSSIYYSAYTVLPEQGFEQMNSGSSLIKTGLVSAILGFSGVYVP